MSSAAAPRTALIVGASRGLGLGLAEEYLRRGWTVTATVRGRAQTGLHALQETVGARLEIERLDIDDADDLAGLAERLSGRSFDVLFVNAGVANDRQEHIGLVSTAEFTRVMTTNALSPLRVIEALRERVTPAGCIAVMSSGLASIANNEAGGFEIYRASKAALNMLLRSYAVRHAEAAHCLLAIAPGWVRTDMGGADAPLDVETSIRGVVDTLAAQEGRRGLQFLSYLGATLPW